MGLHLLVKVCPLKRFKFYLALSKCLKIQKSSSSEGYVDAKNSVCAQDIKRFHIAKSEKFYWSSKSSESWSGGASLAAYNHMSDRLFKPDVRWKWHKVNYRYTKDTLESLLSVSKNLATSYSPPRPLPKKKQPLLWGTREHGTTSRQLLFSFTHPVVEKK